MLVTWLFLHAILTVASAKETVEDYYAAWTQRVFNSKNWKRPTSHEEYRADLNNCEDFGIYDYVIAGGAASGPVLANRLSEVENWSVLYLEQEHYLHPEMPDFDLTPGAKYYQEVSTSNFGYLTERQTEACLQMKDERCTMDIGKRGSPDDIYHIRGNKADFDGWALKGFPAWAYDKVLPFFQAAERVLIPELLNNSCRSANGTLPVEYAKTSKLLEHVLLAHKELGYTVGDYNGPTQAHVSKMQVHVRQGVRQTAHEVYLNPIRDQRKNLKTLEGAFPVKIEINSERVVTQLTFTHRGRCYNAFPQRELILTGSAVLTPHLLMHSGLGPKAELEKYDIPIIKELPVGYHLLDYPTFEIQFRTNFCTLYDRLTEIFENYISTRSGPLATPYAQVIAFCKVNANETRPSFMVTYSSPRTYDAIAIRRNYYNCKDDIMDNYLYSLRPNDILAQLTFFDFKNTGRILLRSCNPFDHPIIDLAYRYNDHNRKAYDQILKLLKTKAFGTLGASLGPNFVNECRNSSLSSKNVKKCLLKHLTRANSDPMGGCRMGDVVDQYLLVLGVGKLRIVDSSVIPCELRGNTASFLVMAGEYIAKMIKDGLPEEECDKEL